LDIEYRVKSSFFQHFSKSITGFNYSDPDKFIIGVLGDSRITEVAKNMYKNTKINNKEVVIENYNSISQCKQCQILFISRKFDSDIDKIIQFCEKKSILTMAESEGMARKGIMINFFVTDDGKLSFEINPRAIRRAKLEFDLYILNIGVVVGE
jgi:hypothetical protein